MIIPMINTSQQNDETEGEENTNIDEDNGGSNNHEVCDTPPLQQILEEDMSDMCSSTRSSASHHGVGQNNVAEQDVAPVRVVSIEGSHH
jgi:hypothetical protein